MFKNLKYMCTRRCQFWTYDWSRVGGVKGRAYLSLFQPDRTKVCWKNCVLKTYKRKEAKDIWLANSDGTTGNDSAIRALFRGLFLTACFIVRTIWRASGLPGANSWLCLCLKTTSTLSAAAAALGHDLRSEYFQRFVDLVSKFRWTQSHQ